MYTISIVSIRFSHLWADTRLNNESQTVIIELTEPLERAVVILLWLKSIPALLEIFN